MSRKTAWLVALMAPALAWAQDPAAPADPEAKKAEILAALDLPEQAQALRRDGVPTEEVAQALEASQSRGVSAGETERTMERAHEAVREHGHVDNFGDFVQSKLDEGLRGQDLAAAIRAEHEARGKGKPEHAGGPGGDHGKPEGAGDGHDDDEHGKPEGAGGGHDDDEHGKPEGAGKPESAGKPDDAGGPMTRPAPPGGSPPDSRGGGGGR